MNLLQEVQKFAIKKQMPELKPGITVKIHQKIQEGAKSRIQIFQGLIIKINSGFGADKTITVRKVTDGIGVEKTFPVYSTNIEKIVIVKTAKVRRAKLYYLRSRFGKSARMKEELMGQNIENSSRDFEEEVIEDVNETVSEEEQTPVIEETPAEEAPVAEETPAEEPKTEEANS